MAMQFLTYTNPPKDVNKLAETKTGWEDAHLTVANLENENALLRNKNAELASQLNVAQGKLPPVQTADQQTLHQLERQCRDLEDYIGELEEKRAKAVDTRLLDDERLKVRDLTSRVGYLESHNDRLQKERAGLEKENLEFRDQGNALRKELTESKELLGQSERMLATTKEKWEVAETDRDKLRKDLKAVEDREVKHLEIQKAGTHRADTLQAELEGVKKWYADRKCKCLRKTTEPWKKYM